MYKLLLLVGLLFVNQTGLAKQSGTTIRQVNRPLVRSTKNRVHPVNNRVLLVDYSVPNRTFQLTRDPVSSIQNAPTGPTGAVCLTMQSDLVLTNTVICSGTTAINGNGNVLTLGIGGAIQIDSSSSLTMKNVILKGITGGNVFCVDGTGEVIAQGVAWIQDGNYTFSQGALAITSNLDCIGNGYTFNYTSGQPWMIQSGASMVIDYGLTFNYDPISEDPSLFTFADQSATLEINGGTLAVGSGGLQLTVGTLFIENESFLTAASGSGITIGGGAGADDLECVFGNGAILNLTSGSLTYTNVNESSWNMRDPNATLKINGGCTINVDQTLDLGPGNLDVSSSGHLNGSDNVIGSVNFF